MTLTEEQERAIQLVKSLVDTKKNGGGIGIITGFAGSGKTVTLSEIQQLFPDLLVVAPTGKAALRAQEAGVDNAKTIHSWLYKVATDPRTGVLLVTPKSPKEIERPECGLVIVDEASMVNLEMFRDIYKTASAAELNVVFVGDPFQLPPVTKEGSSEPFSVFDPRLPVHFRISLSKIHRQALDSPVLRLSLQLRGTDWQSIVFDEIETRSGATVEDVGRAAWDLFEDGGTAICHTNALRCKINNEARKAAGIIEFESLKSSEPLLITQNDYSIEVYNGEITQFAGQPVFMDGIGVKDPQKQAVSFVSFFEARIKAASTRQFHNIVISDKEVLGTLGEVNPFFVKKEYAKQRFKKFGEQQPTIPYIHANLGYVLTAHKSQGSEFPSVAVIVEPSIKLNTEFGRRWMYTSITRTKKHLKLFFME